MHFIFRTHHRRRAHYNREHPLGIVLFAWRDYNRGRVADAFDASSVSSKRNVWSRAARHLQQTADERLNITNAQRSTVGIYQQRAVC